MEFAFENLDFSFPVTTGANAQIRLDQTRLGVGQIIAVYKKLRLSGSTSTPGITQEDADERYVRNTKRLALIKYYYLLRYVSKYFISSDVNDYDYINLTANSGSELRINRC